jgi:lipopolysaccharide/colanic/teichoic acid biosynthesis glycosyltransferase
VSSTGEEGIDGPFVAPKRLVRSPIPAPGFYRWSKRTLDIVFGALAFALAAPILAVAALLIAWTSPGPIFFKQVRIGHKGRPFVMLKLRTMSAGPQDETALMRFWQRQLDGKATPDRGSKLHRIGHDPRVTAVGRVLGRLSIDELPQLINVLSGEMSLVGPRAILPWQAEPLTEQQRRRDDCLPGMTGLWQVSGRNSLSLPQMLELDQRYVERRSFWFDLKILARTPKAVLIDRYTL